MFYGGKQGQKVQKFSIGVKILSSNEYQHKSEEGFVDVDKYTKRRITYLNRIKYAESNTKLKMATQTRRNDTERRDASTFLILVLNY